MPQMAISGDVSGTLNLTLNRSGGRVSIKRRTRDVEVLRQKIKRPLVLPQAAQV
jgi:hypothetical protein